MLGLGTKVRLTVGGMSCAHCERTLEEGVGLLEGVRGVVANHEKGEVEVRLKGDAETVLEGVRAKIEELGYEVVETTKA